MKGMPLTDHAWALIVDATPGGVQGKAFWMARRTWVHIMQERRHNKPGTLYSVPVMFDDSMPVDAIRLERRNAK